MSHNPEFWEIAFVEKQMMWGTDPCVSATLAKDYLAENGAKHVLIPGVGYGRNVRVFLEHGMSVTGIEISSTAIALARSTLDISIPIHHGSVTDMPYDDQQYDGIFCYGLIYLLNAQERHKFIRDCYRQLASPGHMIFTVISKDAPMFGRGTKLDEDWYETFPGLTMYFYDTASIQREFAGVGFVESFRVEEPHPGGGSLPFINVVCKKG